MRRINRRLAWKREHSATVSSRLLSVCLYVGPRRNSLRVQITLTAFDTIFRLRNSFSAL